LDEALFDEALVLMNNVNGHRLICYAAKNGEVPKVFVFKRNPKLLKNFRVIMILNGLSTVLLFTVPIEVEINVGYYVKYALTSLLPINFDCFYPRDMEKVFFYHDEAFKSYLYFDHQLLEVNKGLAGHVLSQ
jgi:hypothetical protein